MMFDRRLAVILMAILLVSSWPIFILGLILFFWQRHDERKGGMIK